MSIQIHKLGKNAALEDSIITFQQTLLDAGFTIVEHSWLNPIANVWSVEVHEQACPLLTCQGKGRTKNAALANALETFIERLATHYFWSDYYLGDEISKWKCVHFTDEKWFLTMANGSWPDGVLNEELQAFYNPIGELNASDLIDTNSANYSRGICCVPFENLASGETLNFPINIIDNLYRSNGIAIGKSVEEARLKALAEILESYVQFKVIAEGISLPEVPDAVLDRYPHVQENIKEITQAGFALLVQDASLGGKFPVLAVAIINPQNQGVSVSFGAHPKFEVALERCFTRLLQGQKLDQLDSFAEAGFDMDEIASPNNLALHFSEAIDDNGIVSWNFLKDKSDYDYADWGKLETTESQEDELSQLCDIIYAEGNDIFIAEHNVFDAYTCRLIVPGMSEISPIDDLVWENNNAGMKVRKQILKPNKTVDECETLIENLEDLNQDDEKLVSELIGMYSDPDNIFEDLCVAELITLLALKTQDNERIQEGCEWLLHYKKIHPRRLKTYQCVNTILQLDGMTNYANALEKLYTRPILNDALALIDGEDVFPLVSDWKRHGLLIEAYKKLPHSK